MNRNGFHSLAVKATLLVTLGTSLVFSVVQLYSYMNSREIILENAETSAKLLALSTARQMDLELRSVAEAIEQFAAVLENVQLDRNTLLGLIHKLVQDQQEIFGSTVSFEPYAFDKDIKLFAPYYYKGKDGLQFEDLTVESYGYLSKDWYCRPKGLRAPVWSPPYFDEGGGNIIMTTYSYPFFKKSAVVENREVAGILTADVSVDWLTKELSSVTVGRTGYCFLVSETGTFLAHPDKTLVMNESLYTLADKLGKPNLKEVGRLMLREESGFADLGEAFRGQRAYLAFSRLKTTGWSLGVVFPHDELFADVNALHRTNNFLAFAGIALLLVVSVVISGSITRPLRRMAKVAGEVAEGRLDVQVPDVKRKDEVGRLARSFANMTVDLKKYIRELTETTAAKERIESELAVAAQIQRSMVPSQFPAFPDRHDFDIYAYMNPAKEVGGDFYQFFFADETHLCLAIGDVSGKGVPAALFMAVTTSLLQSAAAQGEGSAEILQSLNRQLLRGNDTCMFVTVFCGIIDLATGELSYSTAGHDAPLIINDAHKVAPLKQTGGPVLGILEEAEFAVEKVRLSPGDALFAYTDGVTEAFNPAGEMYSIGRLRSQLELSADKDVQQMIREVVDAVAAFAGEAPQSDDLTALAIRINASVPAHEER